MDARVVGEAPRLCDFLRDQHDRIIDEWAKAVRSLPIARSLAQPRLIDHLPALLRQIADLVELGLEAEPASLGDLPMQHALDRFDIGFDLKQVAIEYALLRDHVLRMYQASHGTQARIDEVRRFNSALDQAIAEAAHSYAKQRERSLAALDQVSAATIGNLPLADLLQRLLAVFTNASEAVDSSTILLLEEDGRLHTRASIGLLEEVTHGFSVAVGEGFAGRVALERRPLSLRDAATDPLVLSPYVRRHNFRALYGVPLLLDEHLIGVAHMGSRTAFDFSEDDKLLFRILTERTSTLIYESVLRDQSAKREALERERLKAILGATPTPVALIDEQHNILFANSGLVRLWGQAPTSDAVAFASAMRYRREDGSPYPADELPGIRALHGDTVRDEEVRLVRPDGTERIVLISAAPLHDESHVSAAVITYVDVTEERRAADQRQFLLRAVGELTASLDYEHILQKLARVAVPKLADWCAVDLRDDGRPKRVALAHVDSRKLKLVEEIYRRYPDAPDGPTGTPHILRTGEVEFFPHLPRELLAKAARDPEHLRLIEELDLSSWMAVPLKVRGSTIGVLTLAMAESHRHYTEEDLEFAKAFADRAALAIDNARLFRETVRARRQSEETFRLLVDSVKDYAIYMLGPNGIVTTWNRAAERIKGYTADEVIGKHFSMFYSEDAVRDRVYERDLEIAKTEGRFEEEGWRRRKDGSRFWANIVITPILAADGTLRGFAKVTRDLTERKRAEEELLRETTRRAAAEQTSEFAQKFIGVLAHDLRSPLNAISMTAQMLRRKHPALLQGLTRIDNSALRMHRMIVDLLDFTHGRLGGGIPVLRVPAELLAVCASVIDEQRAAHPDRTITFHHDGDSSGDFDRDRMAQVVSNLVTNALVHGDPVKPVAVRVREDGGFVVLEVANSGPPIPPDVLPHLFDPFRRGARQDGKQISAGLGLGLYIVKEIVRAHGGTVTARSDEEETVFTVRVPRR